VQEDPLTEGGSDPGVEPGIGEPAPDDAGLEDMRPEPHDPDDELA
jgi:hypothetical protein